MRRMRRIGCAAAASLLGAAVAALGVAGPAYAATVNVTTASDVVNAADGVTSLREAISAANAAVEPTTIVLVAGTTYQLSLCGADEDANASGDLDHDNATR